MRVPQPNGDVGSLRWMQWLVTADPAVLQAGLEEPDALEFGTITWQSPRADDGWAAYRDRSFLERIGHPDLAPALRGFWPVRGPQWDGLGRTADGTVVLVEAKAHAAELRSRCAAGTRSQVRIRAALQETARALGVGVTPAWTHGHYQYANRLAHLHFLRSHGVAALLLCVHVVGDATMGGPTSAAQWRVPLGNMYTALGLTPPLPGVVNAFAWAGEISSHAEQREAAISSG